MEEACGFGLAKRTSTLGSPTSYVKHNIGVPTRSCEFRNLRPTTCDDLTLRNLSDHKVVGGHRFDFDFSFHVAGIDPCGLDHRRHSLVIVFNLDVSVHVPLVLDLRTVQNLIQPSQIEEVDVVGPVRGADPPLSRSANVGVDGSCTGFTLSLIHI